MLLRQDLSCLGLLFGIFLPINVAVPSLVFLGEVGLRMIGLSQRDVEPRLVFCSVKRGLSHCGKAQVHFQLHFGMFRTTRYSTVALEARHRRCPELKSRQIPRERNRDCDEKIKSYNNP